MIPTETDVSTIYASCDDPAAEQDGYEIKVARAPSGCVESVVILDYGEGELLELPIEVAMLFAEVLLSLQLRPLSPAPFTHTLVFQSDDVPGLEQDGFLITLLRDQRNAAEDYILTDAQEDAEILCPPAIAYAMAAAISALDAFPAHRVH